MKFLFRHRDHPLFNTFSDSNAKNCERIPSGFIRRRHVRWIWGIPLNLRSSECFEIKWQQKKLRVSIQFSLVPLFALVLVSLRTAHIHMVKPTQQPSIERHIITPSRFHTRPSFITARRKCFNWKRKTTNSSFYLLTGGSASSDGVCTDAIASTTIARFCSHFTNYVGRREHFVFQ